MLRERHVKLLEKIMKGEGFEWKVLILDTTGQDIVAPLFRLNELMELGIVQCLKIDEPRAAVHEARAVYLVEETKANVEAIKADVAQGKYQQVELVFTGTLPRGLFEDLAVTIGRLGESQRVARVIDGLLRLCVLHSSLYTLNLPESFLGRPNPAAIETGLVSLSREIDAPVLFADKPYQGLAEAVAKRVRSLGRPSASSPKRSAVIILGRELDLLTPIEHGWTYSALVNEVLEYDLNKVTIPKSLVKAEQLIGVDTPTGPQIFDLNRFDSFWNLNQNEYFPTAAERVEQELGEYKADLAQRSITASSSKEVISGALSKAPELAQKNKLIHTHLTLSLSLVEEIKQQKIDELFSLENDTANVGDIRDELADLLPKVTAEHFLRLCAVLIKRFPREREYLEGLAKQKGCQLGVLRFLTAGSGGFEGRRSMVSGAASSLLRNIKRILPSKKKLPVTAAVEDVVNGRSSYHSIEVFPDGQPGKFSSVHVFMVGGGTFTEYKALSELADELNLEITFGTTEILTASKLIAQITEHLKSGSG